MKTETGSYNLAMIRGDSESITISCETAQNEPIALVTGDTIYFTVKVNTSTDTKLLQKIITAFDGGVAVIELVPSDTKLLRYGSYRYDVQLVRGDGRVTTLVPPSAFIIEPEVTYE